MSELRLCTGGKDGRFERWGHEVGELRGQDFEWGFAIGRHHIEAVNLVALRFEERLQLFKNGFGVPHAMDKNDGIRFERSHAENF